MTMASPNGPALPPTEADGTTTNARGPPTSRRTVLSLGVAATVGSMPGCIGIVGEEDLPTVSYRHRFDRSGIGSAVYDAGVDFGLWEDEGLEVEFQTSSGSEAAAQSVAAKEDEFANAEIGAVLGLIDNDAPLRIIAQETTPMGGVISLADTEIGTWSDLEGKIVSRFAWAVTGSLAREALRAQGGDPDAVEWRNVDPGAHQSLLIAGEIDAAVAYYPQAVTRLSHEGYETNVLALSDVLNHLGNTVITHEDYLEEHPDQVNAFVRGWLHAHERFISEPDEVIEVHREQVATFDEEVERKVLPSIFASKIDPDVSLDHGMGWTERGRMENTVEVLSDVEILETIEDVGPVYTNRFIEENQDLARETAELYDDILHDEHEIDPDDV